jgi:hypothetical protein
MPGLNVEKLCFYFVADAAAKQAEIFVCDKSFQATLIFAKNVGAYLPDISTL